MAREAAISVSMYPDMVLAVTRHYVSMALIANKTFLLLFFSPKICTQIASRNQSNTIDTIKLLPYTTCTLNHFDPFYSSEM